MKWTMIVAVLVVSGFALGEDAPRKEQVDPEAYKAAMEKLKSKSVPVSAAQETDIEVLRAENAAMRQRISELEAILGLRAKWAAPQRQSKTFVTFQDMINTIKPPADPRKEWSAIQEEKAQHDIEASVVGCTFKATMRLEGATHSSKGFVCSFSRMGAGGRREDLGCTFDSRYSDLITSWKVGQSVSLTGTIDRVEIVQNSKAPGGLKLVGVSLKDCVPN